MAHIELNNGEPGIRGLMVYSPETAKPLNELAEQLLRSPDNSLSPGEREFIAAYVSHLNDCFFCQNVHGAIAGYHLSCNLDEIDEMKVNPANANLSDKMKSLLPIAAAVQKGGKQVTQELVDDARKKGATDKEIHDTVLIAAAFCMYNRYVDGLGTWAPEDRNVYISRAELRAREGYINSVPPAGVKK